MTPTSKSSWTDSAASSQGPRSRPLRRRSLLRNQPMLHRPQSQLALVVCRRRAAANRSPLDAEMARSSVSRSLCARDVGAAAALDGAGPGPAQLRSAGGVDRFKLPELACKRKVITSSLKVSPLVNRWCRSTDRHVKLMGPGIASWNSPQST